MRYINRLFTYLLTYLLTYFLRAFFMHAGFDIPLIRVSLSVELHRIHMLVGHCPAIGTNVLGDNDQFEVLNEHVITTKNNFTVCNAGFPVAADAVNPDMRVVPTYTFRR